LIQPKISESYLELWKKRVEEKKEKDGQKLPNDVERVKFANLNFIYLFYFILFINLLRLKMFYFFISKKKKS